jgi:hypothetical protein
MLHHRESFFSSCLRLRIDRGDGTPSGNTEAPMTEMFPKLTENAFFDGFSLSLSGGHPPLNPPKKSDFP